jgi:hypothetical protein
MKRDRIGFLTCCWIVLAAAVCLSAAGVEDYHQRRAPKSIFPEFLSPEQIKEQQESEERQRIAGMAKSIFFVGMLIGVGFLLAWKAMLLARRSGRDKVNGHKPSQPRNDRSS